MNAKNRAKAAALGISVQSITPELAEKWGTLMSPGPRRGQSKPATPESQPGTANPNSKTLPAGEHLPDKAGLQAGNMNEKGLQENPGKQLLNREPVIPDKKDPVNQILQHGVVAMLGTEPIERRRYEQQIEE